jgi:predicted lipid-binding transport protein (Tim44 family)
MSEGFAYLDILILAMVAAFIAYRLRSVLGRRTGHERRRPSSIGASPAQRPSDRMVSVPDQENPSGGASEPVQDSRDGTLKTGVTAIRLADPSFDTDTFLRGARAAFTMIVEAFAKGDKDTLRPLLAGPVFASFSAAIDERSAKGLTHTTELVSVGAVDLAAAEMRGTRARVTVRFESEQINVSRDAEGHVAEGDPNQLEKVVDLWAFERDTRSRDPNWELVETRSPE